MLKEIHEQPKAVRDTISPRIHDKEIDLGEIGMTDEEIKISGKYPSLPAHPPIIPVQPENM